MTSELFEPAQRTTLAWRRTGLSIFAIGLVTIRGLPHASVPGSPVAGGVILGLAVVVQVLGVRLAHRRARDLAGHRPRATLGELAPVAVGTALVGTAALVLAVVWR